MFNILVHLGNLLVIFMLTLFWCGVSVVVLDHAEIPIIGRLMIISLLFGATIWLVSKLLKLVFASELASGQSTNDTEKKKKRLPQVEESALL